jgi:uncharacterized protein (DUF58 family)
LAVGKIRCSTWEQNSELIRETGRAAVTRDIPTRRVESSNIAEIGYDPETRTARVRFRNGGTYDVRLVTPDEFAEFEAAESKGQHFAKYLAGKPVKKVQRED